MDLERTGHESVTETISFDIAQVCLAPVLGLSTNPDSIRAFMVYALVKTGEKTWELRDTIECQTSEDGAIFEKVIHESVA